MQQHGTVSRVHRSWLAERERRLLVWLAAHLPRAVAPDHLTLLGVAGALLCGLSFAATAHSPRWLGVACLGLLLNWFGDSLDGTLARHRRIERPGYGFFIDHSTDVISQAFIFIGLGASPLMRFDTACLLLMSYWLAALYTFIRALATRVFQISYFGIGPTEIRIGLAAYALAALALGPLALDTRFGPLSPLDVIAIAIFAAVFGSFIALVCTEGRRLARLERPPEPSLPREPWALGLDADGL